MFAKVKGRRIEAAKHFISWANGFATFRALEELVGALWSGQQYLSLPMSQFFIFQLSHWLNRCSLTGDVLVPNLIRMVSGHSVNNWGAGVFLSRARVSSPDFEGRLGLCDKFRIEFEMSMSQALTSLSITQAINMAHASCVSANAFICVASASLRPEWLTRWQNTLY